jgi:hypothetical protein
MTARRRWAQSEEIGGVQSQEIRWVQSREIGWAQSDEILQYALKSEQMDELELVHNLWMVLLSQVGRRVLSVEEAKLSARLAALTAALERLAGDNARPNNALQARTALALLSISQAPRGEENTLPEHIWTTFNQIVDEAQNLGDYPFERLVTIIQELGAAGAGEGQAFDKLFESIVAAMEKRQGETASAALLRDRGFQRLQAKKPYEAIGLLGRAMERFAKREHRHDLIFCLMALSDAYIDAGLLWAARSSALAAAERCLAYFREQGKLIGFSLSAIAQLMMVDLRLGRLAHVLMAAELENYLAPQVALTEKRRASFDEHRQLTDGMLGISMLSASISQLRELDRLPEALDALGLSISKACLLYSLGYRDEPTSPRFQ